LFVAVAVATEKILSLTKHFAKHKKDVASFRGYQAILTNRRKMLQYLKRKNLEEYHLVVEKLGLKIK
jgi:small subunit ribosomal protein S15